MVCGVAVELRTSTSAGHGLISARRYGPQPWAKRLERQVGLRKPEFWRSLAESFLPYPCLQQLTRNFKLKHIDSLIPFYRSPETASRCSLPKSEGKATFPGLGVHGDAEESAVAEHSVCAVMAGEPPALSARKGQEWSSGPASRAGRARKLAEAAALAPGETRTQLNSPQPRYTSLLRPCWPLSGHAPSTSAFLGLLLSQANLAATRPRPPPPITPTSSNHAQLPLATPPFQPRLSPSCSSCPPTAEAVGNEAW
jgi:hypothetical protein